MKKGISTGPRQNADGGRDETPCDDHPDSRFEHDDRNKHTMAHSKQFRQH